MIHLPVRDDIRGEVPYGAPQINVPVCLNVNENPYSPASVVVEEIAQRVALAARTLNRYPERDFHELRAALAEYLAAESGVSVAPEQVWAANGSNEVMLHILQAFGGPGRSLVSCTPTYSMYPEYARDACTQYVSVPRRSDYSLDMPRIRSVVAELHPSVIVVASPNNPTGTALAIEELQELLELTRDSGPFVNDSACGSVVDVDIRHAGIGSIGCDANVAAERRAATLVVVDEAYAEFRRSGVPSALELLAEYPHLVVSRTMSKAFGAAGLRLGYMAASKEIIDYVMLVRLPYHLSALTQAAACAALKHRESLMAQVEKIRKDRDALSRDIEACGCSVIPSDANFVLFGKFADRHSVWQGLLDRGVLIREVGPEGFLRVSVGTPEENAAFLAALKEVL